MEHSVKKLWNTILVTKKDMELSNSVKRLTAMEFHAV